MWPIIRSTYSRYLLHHACLLFFYLPCILSIAPIFPAEAIAESAILEIILNHESKGDYFVEASADGDFLVKLEDFDTLGVPKPNTEPITIETESYFSLSEHQGLSFTLNEQTLALEIDINPDVLPLNRIDFTNRRPDNIYEPVEDSFFINYGIAASGNKDDALQLIDLTHEIALRKSNTLFLTDGIYAKSTSNAEYIRLLSRAIREDQEKLRRFTAGDQYTSSGLLGSQVLIGGIGYSKNFNMAPYTINYPSIQTGGVAATPSEVEIYVDGMLMRKEDLAPGPFVIENITRYEGAGDIEIIIRDAFNQERRLSHPFYLAENLLLPDKHEFNYSAGILRENFGTESNSYGDALFSGFHRYGVRDWLTVGLAGEISPDFFNLVPRASMKWKHYGFFDIAIGASSGSGDNSGYAAALEYSYRNRRFSTGVKFRTYSEHYSRLANSSRTDKPAIEAQLRVGYATPSFGSLNLGFSSATFHVGEDRNEATLTYSRRLSRSLSMYATVNQLSSTRNETLLLLGFNFSPWRQNQISARIENRENSRTAAIGIQKNPPLGSGYGYRAGIDITQTDVNDSYAVNAAGQYNARHAILRGETDLASVDSEFSPTYHASVTGAITHIGAETYMTRPIRDSFTLVKVGDIEGVRVVRNSEVIGSTDKTGTVLVPELTSYYDNQIAVKDEDIPIEYGLETSLQYVQPPLRSGSCVVFSTKKIQPLVGKFYYKEGEKKLPYEYRPLTIHLDNSVIETQTGYDGEFYIDITEAGGGHAILLGCEHIKTAKAGTQQNSLKVEYNYDGNTGLFELDIPLSEELFIDTGQLILNEHQFFDEKEM